MKLEQIPGDYDNVDQRALELLKTNDYELGETSILETLRMKYFIHSNIETL
jgi:hypothetical protein